MTVGVEGVLAACVAVMAGAAATAIFFSRWRIRRMKAAAVALGLTPLSKGELFRFESVPLMRQKGRGIGVVLTGSWRDVPVLVFDLFHPAGQGVSTQTVLMMRLEHVYFPEFALVERSLSYAYPSVDLPPVEHSPRDLGKHWHVYSRDGKWPFPVALADWLADCQVEPGLFGRCWSFEGHGRTLYVYHRSTRARADRLEGWLDEAVGVAREFAGRC